MIITAPETGRILRQYSIMGGYVMYEKLFSPAKLGRLEIKNRVVMEPMGNCLAALDGSCTDEDAAFYAERAKGGTGLIIAETTSVDYEHGRANLHNLALHCDENIPSFRKLADAVHEYGSHVFVELYHPGRQGMCIINQNEPMAAPSVTECQSVHQPTREMTTQECYEMVDKYVSAAVRAQKAGIDGVMLHAAHGYLLTQFLSPYTNKRTDEFGGSLENRARIVLLIMKGIREKCGDYPMAIRISADEFLDTIGLPKEAGITLEMSKEYAKMFEEAGCDAIDVSCGIYETMNTAWEPAGYDQGWKAYLAAEIKKTVSIPVFCTSLIRDPAYAEKLLNDGVCDFVGSARQQFADPEWANKAMQGREKEIRKCISCLNCMATLMFADATEVPCQCAVNIAGGSELKYGKFKEDGDGRTVVVIGAGPAGLEAARVLAMRGFKPVVLEKSSKIGGQLVFASAPPKKEKLNWLVDYYRSQCEKYGIEIRLNTPATEELVRSLQPYGVIVASGSVPVMPGSIEGIRGKNVYTVADILSGNKKFFGKNIIVVGSGMSGLETAEYLAFEGNTVSVYEMADTIGPDMFFQNMIDVQSRLAIHDVQQYPKHKLVRITEDGCEFELTESGEQKTVTADAVIVSLGVRPAPVDMSSLEGVKVVTVGDAVKGGKIRSAVEGGFMAAFDF